MEEANNMAPAQQRGLILLFIAYLTATIVVTVYTPTWIAKPGQYAQDYTVPEMRILKEKAKKQGHIALGASLGACVVLGFALFYSQDKQSTRTHWKTLTLAFLCLGLLFGAYTPQLLTNTYLKSHATDNITAVYLLLLIVGMCLKLTTYRFTYEKLLQEYNDDNKKYELLMYLFIMFTTVIPVLLTNVWQWQCYLYDSDEASYQRNLNRWLAPLCSFLVIFMSIHTFLPIRKSVLSIKVIPLPTGFG